MDLIEKGKEYNLEFDIITQDKKERKSIHSIAELEKDANGNSLKITGIIIDITERKILDEALKKSEEKYRTFVETSFEGIWALDENLNTAFVNKRIGEMLGYGPEEMMGKNISEFVVKEDMELHNNEMSKKKKRTAGAL